MTDNQPNFEFELKYKLEHGVNINIENYNFSLVSVKHQIDTYFMVNEVIDGKRTYIRLREDLNKNKGSFDHHGVVDAFTAEEKEVPMSIDDAKKIKEALIILGNKIVCVVDKKRSTYERDSVSVMLDEVKDLGNFVEVEVVAGQEKRNESVALIKDMAVELGLKPENVVSGIGYPDLFLK